MKFDESLLKDQSRQNVWGPAMLFHCPIQEMTELEKHFASIEDAALGEIRALDTHGMTVTTG